MKKVSKRQKRRDEILKDLRRDDELRIPLKQPRVPEDDFIPESDQEMKPKRHGRDEWPQRIIDVDEQLKDLGFDDEVSGDDLSP